jgi:hypothetical protein
MLLRNLKSLKKAAVISVACCSVLGSLVLAQVRNRRTDDPVDQAIPRKRPKGKTPRALAVLEITNGRARLLPVSILIDGKFYDASVYKADPMPMAVEPQTVYEGQKMGESLGLFTINNAQELSGNWIGLGIWRPKGSEKAAPKKAKPNTGSKSMDDADDDGPPRLLRRDKPESDSDTSAPATTPAATTAPASTSAPTTAASSAAQTAPTASPASSTAAKPSLSPAAQAESKPEPAPSEQDPNRPVLRRGKPGEEQAVKIPIPGDTGSQSAPVAGTKITAVGLQPPPGFTQTLAAISDAGGPTEESFNISLKPDELNGYTGKMSQYATEAIRRFETRHSVGSRPAPPHFSLLDLQVRAFDVNGSNEPVLVLSARAPEMAGAATAAKPGTRASRSRAAVQKAAQSEAAPANTLPGTATGRQYYVTIVARVDVNGDVRKLFESVTDNSHLDAYPRLQLIDCVDADGDGVGELLFRETYDRSRAFAVYRVGMDQLWQLFEGAQTSFSAGQ